MRQRAFQRRWCARRNLRRGWRARSTSARLLRLGKSENDQPLRVGRARRRFWVTRWRPVIAAVYPRRRRFRRSAQGGPAAVGAPGGRRGPKDARDAKTALQEWAQARGGNGHRPSKRGIVRAAALNHAPGVPGSGARLAGWAAWPKAEGRVKRQAEQAAARALLDQVDRGIGTGSPPSRRPVRGGWSAPSRSPEHNLRNRREGVTGWNGRR